MMQNFRPWLGTSGHSLVPEEDIVKLIENHIVPKMPYRGKDDEEDLNNSNGI